jgi:hypothetical protein
MRRQIGPALLLLVVTSAGAQQDRPCTAPEHRQFDFWIGTWEVVTPDGKLAGRNTIQSILNGCALEESWRGAGGSIGKSLNMYYARDSEWLRSWVDGNGGRLDLAGGLDPDGRMVLAGKMPGPDGVEVLHEISWEALGDGTVRQHWRALREDSEDWRDVFVGIYRRAASSTPRADGRDLGHSDGTADP